MFFKKIRDNDALLDAIQGGSVDNVLKGGKLISNHEAVSESEKEAIQRINDNVSEIMEYANGETAKLNMVNEIIHSGM